MIWRNLLLIVAIASVAGCSAPARKTDTGAFLSVSVVYNEETFSGDTVYFVADPVVGNVFGRPSGQEFFKSTVRTGDQLALSLPMIESRLAAAATRYDGAEPAFDPPATRVARLGTLGEVSGSASIAYAAGFRDKTTGRTLVLFYVDRPCSIRGSTHGVDFNVTIGKAGLHWIESSSKPSGGSTEFLADGQSAVIYEVFKQ
jgi:hypothetical protein